MPRIARGEENTPSNVNWFMRDPEEALIDVYQIEFRVFRIEDGLPGVQVFPASDWENVTSPPGRFDVGSYYAYDNANSQGWTPSVNDPIGTHRIFWRWKRIDTSSWQENAEDFEVVEQAPVLTDTIIDVADVRAAGLPDPPYTDAMIETAIRTWQEFLERACRQWFTPRELIVEFDGDNSHEAHFGVPIISVEYLRLNEETSDLGTDYYRVYTEHKNPKISLVQASAYRDIHQTPYLFNRELRFWKGYKNHVVKGVFGCVDASGNPPALIQRALLKLVIEKLTRPIYGPSLGDESSMTFAGVVIQEKTDGHSVKYATPSFAERRVGLSGITQDPEILDIIRLYKAPLGIASTSYWSYL